MNSLPAADRRRVGLEEEHKDPQEFHVSLNQSLHHITSTVSRLFTVELCRLHHFGPEAFEFFLKVAGINQTPPPPPLLEIIILPRYHCTHSPPPRGVQVVRK